MSYTNFIPTIWAEAIERELEKTMVFAEDCNRKYEGKIKKEGDVVKILGVGQPTMYTIDASQRNAEINAPETVETTSVFLPVNQLTYFNYEIGDIDEFQSVSGLAEALRAETTEGLADAQDRHIASMALETEAYKMNSSAAQVQADTILAAIDAAQQKLWENNVKPTTELVLTASPRFCMLLRQKLTILDTDNTERIVNGKIGKYGGITIKMSNNVATSNNGTVDNIMLRTKRAIAFVRPMIHIEPYRPEKKFADAIKGFVLYQAKIVRPKELVVLNVKYTA